MRFNSCYYCGSREISSTFYVLSHEVCVCKLCGLAYTRLAISHKYNVINKKQYSKTYLDNYEYRRNKLLIRFKQRIKEIEQETEGGNLLDIGCSSGMFLSALRTFGVKQWKCFGIDINLESIRQAKKKLHHCTLRNGTLQSIKFKNESFDVITCFDVLEHDPYLPKTFNEIRRILKPGGLLVIQSPNYKSIMAKLCGDNWDWWSIPDHVSHFDSKFLMNVLSRTGFEVNRYWTWEDREDFITNVRGTLRKKLPKKLYINKVISRVMIPSILLFWVVLLLFEKFKPVGGLHIILAKKV